MSKQNTIGEMLRHTTERFPERTALEHLDHSWTYLQFDQKVDQVAKGLLGHGIRKGDRVGIWCETEPTIIFVMYALLRIGAIVTMLNTSLQRDDLKTLLQRTDVQHLIIGDGYRNLKYPLLCHGLKEELPVLKSILYVGQSDKNSEWPTLESLNNKMVSEQEFNLAEASVQPNDTAFILFTSGTTSSPKGTMVGHNSWAQGTLLHAEYLKATEEDRFCVTIPIFHCFCISVNLLMACAVGGCVCLPASRKTADILETVSSRKCTVMSCVPTLYHAMLSRPDFDTWDLSSLRTGIIGGSAYPETFFKEVERKFQFTLISSLGQTEATAGFTTTLLDDPLEIRASTVGRFMNHLEGKIIHPQTGKAQPTGEGGEICIRGFTVMQGYYGLPEETAKALDKDGWLHTGDTGFLDEDGNVHLTGRLKELIIRGGENISPAEIEEVLEGDNRIDMCKAVGVPDEHYGEEICLCVVLKPDTSCDENELRDLLKAKLADFKIPKYILFLESFPISSTGKVSLQELKQIAKNSLKKS